MPEAAEATTTDAGAGDTHEQDSGAVAVAEPVQRSAAPAKPGADQPAAADADAAMNEDYANWRDRENKPDAPEQASDVAKDDPDAQDTGTKGAPPAATKPADPLADLTPDDVQLLKRRHIDPQHLPADPVARQQFLRAQERAQAELDRFFTQRRAGEKPGEPESPEPTTTDTATAKPAVDVDKLWTDLGDGLFTEEGPKRLRETVEKTIAASVAQAMSQLQPLQQQVFEIVRTRAQEQFTGAMSDWAAPQGVDPKDAAVIGKVRDKANMLLNLELAQGKSPLEIDVRKLTHDAASLVFPHKQQAADQQRRTDSARRSVRGSPESGTRAPSTRPAQTEAELEADWFAKNPRK